MSNHHKIIATLIAGIAAVDFCAALVIRGMPRGSEDREVLGFVFLALASSQLRLVGMWLGAGRSSLSSRCLGCAAAMATWQTIFQFGSGRVHPAPLESVEWGLLSLALILWTALGSFIANEAGLKIAQLDETLEPSATNGRFQFTVMDLFRITTTVALLTFVYSPALREVPIDHLGFGFLVVGLWSIPGPIALRMVLGTEDVVLGTCGFGLLMFSFYSLLMALPALATGNGFTFEILTGLFLLLLESALTAFPLVILHRLGYRRVVSAEVSSAEPTPPPAAEQSPWT